MTDLKGLPVTLAQRLRRSLPYLYGLGLCLVIIGLARPQAGKAESRISGQGIAIELVLDVSGSMEAIDFQLAGQDVSRLEAVKHVIEEFVLGSRASGLSGRPDDLVGLVAFGGFADSKCPLTLDHGALVDIVQGLEIPKPIRDSQGRVINAQALQEELATAIGDGVAVGVDRLRGARAKSKVLILLTDGDSNAGVVDPREAARIAAESGYQVVYNRHRPQRHGSHSAGRRIRQPRARAGAVSHRRRPVARNGSDRERAVFSRLRFRGPGAGLRRDRQAGKIGVRGDEVLGIYRIVPLVRRAGAGCDSLDRCLDGNPVSFVAVGRPVERWNGNILQWLYLILPLAAAWLALSLYSRRRRRRAAEAFVAQAMWSRILPPDSRARFWVKLLLRETALVTGLVALAGPRFGTQYEDVIPRGSDLYVLIDVSRSMLAEDVPPSRLGRAKADVAALVNRLEGERVGLIAFAGQAVVKCPLTVDYDAFRRSLDELDPASAPRGGTAIGDAIRKALEVFQARADRDQAILLITDGDDQQSYPLEAAAIAAERHVTIFTVGLGDADHGARIPQGAQAKSYVEYQGQQVWSKLDGSLLKEIALKTSGVYVPVGTRAYDLGELYAKYLQGRRGGEEQSGKRIRRADQFQIFLALALLALLADSFTRPYRVAEKAPVQGLGSAGRKMTSKK